MARGSLRKAESRLKKKNLRFQIGRGERWLRRTLSRGTPHPGCFCERVRNCLKTKELIFCRVQKSAQLHEVKGLESLGTCRANDWRKEGMHPPPPGRFFISVHFERS